MISTGTNKKTPKIKDKKRRVNLWLLLLALFLLVQPILASPNVFATTKLSVEQSVKSKLYFYAIESCLTSLGNARDEPAFDYFQGGEYIRTSENLKDLEWFPSHMNQPVNTDSGNNTIAVGFLEGEIAGSTEDSKVWCDENSNGLLKAAFSFWQGIKSSLTKDYIFKNFVCAEEGVRDGAFVSVDDSSMTYAKVNTTLNCAEASYFRQKDPSPGIEDEITTRFKKLIIDNIYNGFSDSLSGAEPSFTSAETYWLNINLFSTFCATGEKLPSKPDDSSKSFSVDIVQEGIKTTSWYGIPDNKWWGDSPSEIYLWESGNYALSSYGYPLPESGYITTSCKSIVNTINTGADAYLASPEEKGTEKTVGDIDAGNAVTEDTTCAINGVGWFICPIVNFMAKIIDDSWGILTSFLEVNSSIVATNSAGGGVSPTYRAWQMVRNVANVAFAIVFLVIIFSQVTSFGISNYGIKKMLPKLIIAAILVNLSFYICQIAVDASNILGYSIKNVFDGIAKNISAVSILSELPESATGFTGFGGLAVEALTLGIGGGLLYAGVGTLIPVLLSGIVAVLMILFMLIGRQALIILLVVISPLAFVAYLLPNTEKLFDKWKKLLLSLLLLFPIVALVVGASSLASGILNTVFTSNNNPIGQIAAAAVAILPLFVVPGMLKKSLDGVGNIGGTLNKLSGSWGKGLGGKWTGSKLNKHIEAERANKSARIQGGVYEGGKYGKYNPNVWRSKLHSKYNQSNVSGKYGDKMSAMGVSQADKFNDENVGLATSRLNSLGLDKARIESIALGDDEEFGSNLAMRQAAIKDMVATNNVGGINKLWDKTIDMDDSQNSKYIRNAFANSLMSSSSRPAYLGGGAIGAMRIHDKSVTNGQRTYEDAIRSAIGNNTYSPDKLAHADKEEVAELNRVLSLGGLEDNDVGRISKNAKTAISDNKFDVSKNIGEIEKIAELAPAEQVAQPIASSSNGPILVDQNGLPLQSNQPQTFGGSSREPVTTNDNDFVIKDKRIRW